MQRALGGMMLVLGMVALAGCGGDTPPPVATNTGGGGAPPPPTLGGGAPPPPAVGAPAAPFVPGVPLPAGPAQPTEPMGTASAPLPGDPAGSPPPVLGPAGEPLPNPAQPPLVANPGSTDPNTPGFPPVAPMANPADGPAANPGAVLPSDRPGGNPMSVPVQPPVAGVAPPGGVDPTALPPQIDRAPPMAVPGVPMPGVPGEAPVPAAPATLFDKAKIAFATGQDADAMVFYQAAVVLGDGAGDWASQLQWNGPTKRTALAFRWGIGVQYSAPAVPGAGGVPAVRATRGEVAPANPLDQLPPGGDRTPLGILRSVADPLGPKIVEDLQARIQEGHYGAILKEPAAAPGGAAGVDPAIVPGAVVPGGVPGAAPVEAATGLPGAGPISPGLRFLGVGTIKEIVAAGQAEKVDFLVVLNVTQRTIRNNQIKEISLHVHDGSTGKEIWDAKTQTLVNVGGAAPMPARPATKKAEDPLDLLHEKMFRFIDLNTRLTEMPAGLTPQNLGPRLATLTASPAKNPLAVLVELAYYREKGLLEKDAWQAAVGKVLDDTRAAALASDVLETRKQAILALLPSSERKIGGGR